MFSNVTIRRCNFRRCFKRIELPRTPKMLMLLITFPLMLRVFGGTTSLAESEINKLNSEDTQKVAKHVVAVAKQTKLELRQFPLNSFMMPLSPTFQTASPPGCPLCDSSVYSYCSHKLIHDFCCCEFSGAAIYQKPPQCTFYDCTLLYAKSCYEHSLIKNCCCNNPY